jgi:Trk-type K+ transport system membrane component
MVVGGCAGSTTCGIKIFRFQVIYASARCQIGRLLQPHGVFIPYYNKKPIPPDVSEAVMGFFFLFALAFAILALGLSHCQCRAWARQRNRPGVDFRQPAQPGKVASQRRNAGRSA